MSIPSEILSAYGFAAEGIERVTGGLINATYRVKNDRGVAIAALQRLHPVFQASVNEDIEAITGALVEQRLTTPTLVRTLSGDSHATSPEHVWRAITWIPGQCHAKIPNLRVAEQGGKLIARFHRAVHGLDYEFQFKRKGVHDTEAHLQKLRMASQSRDSLPDGLEALRDDILSQAESLPSLPILPSRIVHGDLKISNLLFDDDEQGLCLIDLDTMAHGTIAYELGDALRSWANPQGENVASPVIDPTILAALAKGYASESEGILSSEEIASVVGGLERVSLQLAARFCVDVFEDSYFGWDAKRFPSRKAHNMMRAKGQLALSQSVASDRNHLQELWTKPFVRK